MLRREPTRIELKPEDKEEVELASVDRDRLIGSRHRSLGRFTWFCPQYEQLKKASASEASQRPLASTPAHGVSTRRSFRRRDQSLFDAHHLLTLQDESSDVGKTSIGAARVTSYHGGVSQSF